MTPKRCSRCKLSADKYFSHTQWCGCGATQPCDHYLCPYCKDENDVRLADAHENAKKALRAARKEIEWLQEGICLDVIGNIVDDGRVVWREEP